MGRRVLRSRRGLVLLSVTLIAGASVPAALTVAGGAATAAATATATLDHFDCYPAAATTNSAVRTSFKAAPHTALLKNRFALGGFTAAVGKVQMQCSPVQQTVRATGAKSTITNANARLVCWGIAPKSQKLPATVTVKNQFGTGVLKPTAARSLCMPSWKNSSAPTKFPSTSAPSNLDSYVCYSVVHPAGTPTFKLPSVALKDQFGSATTTVGAPNVLCLPTIRGTNSFGGWTKVVNSTNYSVCFALPVKAAATYTAYDKNQFGVGAVKMSHSTELCVPSVKPAAVTPPTTTTTAPPSAVRTGRRRRRRRSAGTGNCREPCPPNTKVQVFDIDGFDNSAATVAALHAQGTKVICYIDFGSSENFRPDYSSFPASVQGSTNGWPGEKWLDIRQLSVLEPIMTARMKMCVQKGFDALEPDNIDGYTNSTGFPLTAQDQLTYNTWIANEAHSLGLSVGLKNDTDQTAQLQPYFDWALNEQCNEYSECDTENVFVRSNKAVFNAEYSGGTGFCSADGPSTSTARRSTSNLDGAHVPAVHRGLVVTRRATADLRIGDSDAGRADQRDGVAGPRLRTTDVAGLPGGRTGAGLLARAELDLEPRR